MKTIDLPKILEDLEVAYIDRAIKAHNNNITRAANNLGIKRTTLREKLKRYGMLVTPPETVELVTDPEGEFTIKRTGKGYSIFYNGEKIGWKPSRVLANAFIKEKMDE